MGEGGEGGGEGGGGGGGGEGGGGGGGGATNTTKTVVLPISMYIYVEGLCETTGREIKGEIAKGTHIKGEREGGEILGNKRGLSAHLNCP